MSQKDEIRVLFLGDSGVGKTSIIHTIVMESFPKNVDRVFQTVTISPELYLLPNNTNTVLVDSDASEIGPGEQQTNNEIERAHVIVLLYEVGHLECMRRLGNYWLKKRIVTHNPEVPVILCGNKLDLRSHTTEEGELESLLTPNFMEFKQVEMGIECSAKGYIGLIDIIACA
jgi:GTPase SAR1 family protein